MKMTLPGLKQRQLTFKTLLPQHIVLTRVRAPLVALLPPHVVMTHVRSPLVAPAWSVVAHSLPLFLLDLILLPCVVLTPVRSPLVPPAWCVVANSLPLFLLNLILPSVVEMYWLLVLLLFLLDLRV